MNRQSRDQITRTRLAEILKRRCPTIATAAVVFIPAAILQDVNISSFTFRLIFTIQPNGLQSYINTGMRRITMFRSTADRIYDGGPLQWPTEGGGLGGSTSPPPKFRRYRWSPRSHEQEEPASRFPFVVHCILIWL